MLTFFLMENIQESLGSHFEWLLVENGPQLQEDPFHNHGGRQIKCDGLTPLGSKRSLPPVLPTMVGSNEQVCVCPRVLLWRWLGKHCHKSYHCSVIPPFREIFECPPYCSIVIFTNFTITSVHTYLQIATNKINMKKNFHHISLTYANIVRIFH